MHQECNKYVNTNNVLLKKQLKNRRTVKIKSLKYENTTKNQLEICKL